MTSDFIAAKCGFTVANQAEGRGISSVFCGDLLSWAMGSCPEGAAWCTVMGSVNTIAVASLADAACVILCHGATLMDDALQKAKQAEITVLTTDLPEFDAALAIHNACKEL